MASTGLIRVTRGGPTGVLKQIGLSFPEAVIDGTPIESAHIFFQDHAITVGVWETEPGAVRFAAYPVTEFCAVIDGEVTIELPGRTETFRTGDCFLIEKGLPCTWSMPVRMRKFFVENNVNPA